MWRISTVFIAFLLAFLMIVARLSYWQVFSHGKLATEASSQHFFKLELPSKRGNILASDKSPLVINQIAYLVYGEPQKITDKKTVAQKIGKVLGVETSTLFDRISPEKTVWAILERKVEEEKVAQLKDLHITGIGYEREGKRFYPEASMAAQILGFVASDNNGFDTGYFGLEGYYNRELQGKNGSLVQEKDAKGLPILVGEEQRFEPVDGRTLVLHIDKTVQRIVERNLERAMQRYGAKEGSVVILDPKTGGIQAMATSPSYDPRDFLQFPKVRYKNPVVAATYEPGSTFKVLIMAAGINENVIEPDTLYDETGPVPIDKYAIKTWNEEYHGKITMTEVLQYSSNVGMVFVAEKLGNDKMLSYLKDFGFEATTNIDLEEEVVPHIRPKSEWTTIDYATMSFGQGVAVTPIQMLQAVGAIANGGKRMEPHIVKEIVDQNGKVIAIKPKVVNRVISSKTAKQVAEMMVAAVDKGEAQWAKPKGYRIAGKTGTAQIPVSGHYDEEKTIASFVGFAPADDPKFVMLVTLREPTSSPWGSETAAPLFFAISSELFSYYGISPQQ